MASNRTVQNGYYEIKLDLGEGEVGKWLHFSMNFLINLKRERGVDLMGGVDAATEVEQIEFFSDVVYSAMLAYDQEEGEEPNYTIYQVRNAMRYLSIEDQKGLMDALAACMNPVDEGKKKAKK